MRPERIRFYKKVFPNVDDIVIGKVVKIDHYVHVELLEYENREAFISFDELSTKSIKNINSVVKLGGIYPLLTIWK